MIGRRGEWSAGAVAIAAATLLAGAAAPSAGRADDFAFTTFKNFQRQRPGAVPGQSIFDPALPGLAVAVKYTGGTRPVPSSHLDAIVRLGRTLRRPAFAALYRREVEVIEQGRSYWLPVPEPVLAEIAALLNPGQELTVRVRYTGAAAGAGDRLYVLIDFDASPPERPAKSACFARDLLGIGLGQPLGPVIESLTAKYGAPRVAWRGREMVRVFSLDSASGAYLAVGDAGEGYRERVFSLQLVGRPGSRAAGTPGLRFGASQAEVVRALGGPVAVVPAGDGVVRLQTAGSDCSVDLKEGGLAAVSISDDPNYFPE